MSEKPLLLLPMPRQVTLGSGTLTLPEHALIAMSSNSLFTEGRFIQDALTALGLNWELVVGSDYPNTSLLLKLDPALSHPQGYLLIIEAQTVTISGADAAGIYYGVCTLRQILQQYGK